MFGFRSRQVRYLPEISGGRAYYLPENWRQKYSGILSLMVREREVKIDEKPSAKMLLPARKFSPKAP